MRINSQIENLNLLAKQVVEGFIIGLHKSPFHGFSVEFAEHRLYNSGDNLKHIDWKVYGRTDKLFIKKYEEETNLRCQIILDTSSSMIFPEYPKQYNKLEFSCVAAASILQILKKQLDASAIHLFDESIYKSTPCKSNSIHYNQLISELEKTMHRKEHLKSSQTAHVLHQVAERVHKRSLVIIFSDMLDRVSEIDEIFDALQHLKFNKHEVILFYVQDKNLEVEFNYENRPLEFVDLESGEKVKMDNNLIREHFRSKMNQYRKDIEMKCLQYGIDVVDADIHLGFEPVLLSYLIKRNKMI